MAAEIAKEILSKLTIPQPYINNYEELPLSTLGLDAIIGFTFLLTFVHAAISRSLSTLVALFLLALTVEQLSVQLGATHCHTEAVVMITKCSSLNSIIFYVFWMYLSLTTTQALNLSTFGTIAAAGLVQAMLGLCYELQGPTLKWWQYSSENVADAFDERIFALPLMGIYFHMAFGSGFAASIKIAGGKHLSNSSLPRVLLAAFLTPAVAMLYDAPIRAFKLYNIGRFASVPCVSFLLFVLPFLAGKSTPNPKNRIRAPYLFFFTVLQFHAYFAAASFWQGNNSVTLEQLTAVITTVIASLVLTYTAAFPSVVPAVQQATSTVTPTVAQQKPKENKKQK